MATGWQPNDEGARTILSLLERASNSQSNEEHKKLYKDIEEAEAHPEFCSYLAIVLSRLKDKPVGIRHRAALLLKAAVSRGHAKLPAEHIEVIKTEILNAIGAPERPLRVAVSDVIATLATRRSLKQWPDVIQKLTQLLGSTDSNVQLSAIETLAQLAKDCLNQIDDEAIGRPLNQLVPALTQLLGSQTELVRVHAVESLTQFLFIFPTPPIMTSSLDSILKAMNMLMQNDTSVKVKTQLIRMLSALMLNRPAVIAPHMQAVLSYVIDRTLESDESLAIEATDFFPDFFEACVRQGAQKAGMDANVIVPFLEKLLPILLRHMMYSDEMIAEIEMQEEDEDESDGMTMYVGGVHDGRENGMGGPDKSTDWPIRKSAATTLEITAQHLQGTMLKPLLPMLQKQLQNEQEWKARESAILALGAVSDGCYKEMKNHLEQLMPYLFDRLKSNHYFIRSISCWAISRYCNWFLDFEDQRYLLPVIEMLLQKANDEKRFVQQAALSAFATLEETANKRLLPYLPQILTMLMGSFDKYTGRSVLIFYDVLMTLAENVGRETLNEDKYLQAIIPPLLNRWAKLPANDKQIFPLFECVSCFSVTLGPGFMPFAKVTFERALKLLSDILEDIDKANKAEAQGANYKHIPKAFLIAALDLLAGLAEGIGGSLDPLLEGSPLLQLLHHCTRDISPEVRQSAFALFGELVKACFPRIKPHAKEFIQIAADNLDPWYKSVCNNASWSIGELAARLGPDMKPFMQTLMERLIPIMMQMNWDPDLLENTAITLGRLGFVCPEMLAPALQHFIQNWLMVLTQYREDLEKEHAFQGLCRTIEKNPQIILLHFIDFVNAINSFKNPRPQLKTMFAAMLAEYKKNLGDAQWIQIYGRVQDPVRAEMHRRYGIE